MTRIFFCVVLASVASLISCKKSEEPQQKEPVHHIRAMSYNVRYSTSNDGVNAWDNRKHGTIAMLNALQPDVFGVQEALRSQVNYISEKAPQYMNVGVGRDDGKTAGEYMSIFWNSKTIDMLDWGTFWLSPTPDQPSYGWGAGCRRTATWALMKYKKSGNQFVYINTHLDHASAKARTEGLKLVVRKFKELNPNGYPMVLTGDFNVTPDDPCLDELDTKMQSARKVAASTDDYTTYNSWGNKPLEDSYIIDYIYVDGFSSVPFYRTITEPYGGVQYLSDHYPIVAVLCF